MPESTQNNHVRGETCVPSDGWLVAKAMPHVKHRMTTVRMAVARFEFTPATLIFAWSHGEDGKQCRQ